MPIIRCPTASDAAGVHRLVERSDALEANSIYAYLLVCTHFAETSVVAVADDDPAQEAVAGFVAAYRPPTRPEAMFVWQVGVLESERGSGLGSALLDAALASPGARGVRFVEATVAPSNRASDRLFRSFARRHGAQCSVEALFTAEHFGRALHEDEPLYRIGPLSNAA